MSRKRTSTTTRSPSPSSKRQRTTNSQTTGIAGPSNPPQDISPLFSSNAPGLVSDEAAQSTPYDNETFLGPTFGSIFGSARLAFDPPPAVSFNYNLPSEHQSLLSGNIHGNTGYIDPSTLSLANGHSGTGPVLSTTLAAPSPDTGQPKLSTDPHVPFPQIVTFATWEAVGFFLSLHMRHQHVLTPLVHQPSFARDLLHRRDVHDEPFRGLLLSIGESAVFPRCSEADICSGIHVGLRCQGTCLWEGYVKYQSTHFWTRCRAQSLRHYVAGVNEPVERYRCATNRGPTRSPSLRPSCEVLQSWLFGRKG